MSRLQLVLPQYSQSRVHKELVTWLRQSEKSFCCPKIVADWGEGGGGGGGRGEERRGEEKGVMRGFAMTKRASLLRRCGRMLLRNDASSQLAEVRAGELSLLVGT